MSIKIEIIADNAAEMHKELQALLFGPQGPVIKVPGVPLIAAQEERGRFIETDNSGEPSADAEVSAPETVAETPKKKRRTKAEIEAEKKAEQAKSEPEEEATEPEEDPSADIHTEPEEALNPPATEKKVTAEAKVTLDTIRQLIVAKGTPKKPAIANLLQSKYGIQTLPQLKEDQYADLYRDIEAL